MVRSGKKKVCTSCGSQIGPLEKCVTAQVKISERGYEWVTYCDPCKPNYSSQLASAIVLYVRLPK